MAYVAFSRMAKSSTQIWYLWRSRAHRLGIYGEECHLLKSGPDWPVTVPGID